MSIISKVLYLPRTVNFDHMKQILGLDESMEIMNPYYMPLIEAMNNGFDDFVEISKFTAENIGYVDFHNRTKANIIHDCIAQRIIDLFSEKENLKVGVFNKIFGVNVENKLFVRFKKMDKYFNVSNLKTRQHRKYMKQIPFEGFPEELTYLFAGYIPDPTWTGIKGIYLACWRGDNLQWIDEAGKRHSEQLTLKIDFGKAAVHEEIEKKIRLIGKVIKLNNEE